MSLHSLSIEYEEYDSPDRLSEDEQRLVASARKAREYAYAPYSKFWVGAAVLTKDGKIFHGSNQETANYMGSHAEKVALDSAAAAGVKDSISALAIVGGPDHAELDDKTTEPEGPISPCGQCRQDIKEVEDLVGAPLVVIMASGGKVRKITGVKNLLPFAFGPSSLGVSL